MTLKTSPDLSSLKLRRLRWSDAADFDSLQQIYKEAFPGSERKAPSRLAMMIRCPEYIFLAALLEGTLVGFAIMIAFENSSAGLLEYFAVKHELRGHGLGQRIFELAVGERQISDRFLLIEVESDKLPSPHQQISARRKNFYRRLGCKEIERLNYLMPQVSEAVPPPMDLMVYKSALPKSIQRSAVENWLKDCYVQVYDQSATDDRIEAMLKNLPDNLQLI
jgi:GNAT superfamily N-acetyltransferase